MCLLYGVVIKKGYLFQVVYVIGDVHFWVVLYSGCLLKGFQLLYVYDGGLYSLGVYYREFIV